MCITVLLADDHVIFREGLRSLIERNSTAHVVGEAGNGEEAVQLAEKLRPGLVIMDLTMPIMNGIDATREILRSNPEVKILALSMESDRFFVVEALKAGASGYLLKDTAYTELEEAIKTVAMGGAYLPRNISALVVKEFLQRIPQETSPVYETLSSREREILQLTAEGKCAKEIAHLLGTSPKTVENQRHAIMEKLGLFTIAELTKFAVRHGLTTLT